LVDCAQRPAFDQVLEEALHQVLGVFRAESAMTGEGVQWRPVAFAEPSESLGSPFGATLGRFQHEAPARRIKPNMVGRGRTVILIHGRNVKTSKK
jgi:hypothetical protein